MKKYLPTILVVFVIVSLMATVIVGSNNNKASTEIQINPQTVINIDKPEVENYTIVFYYGNMCPHCADVEEWMEQNNIESKIQITKKEVYDNRQNSLELTQVAGNCGLPTDSIGVPFLYAEEKCILGTPDIVDYLSQKAGISERSEK